MQLATAGRVASLSYGMRVCSEEVPSEPLRRLLGWEDAVSPHVLAQQLVEMAGMFGHTLAVNPLAQPLRDNKLRARASPIGARVQRASKHRLVY